MWRIPHPKVTDGWFRKLPVALSLCGGFLATGFVVLTPWKLNNGVWSLLVNICQVTAAEKYKKEHTLFLVSEQYWTRSVAAFLSMHVAAWLNSEDLLDIFRVTTDI